MIETREQLLEHLKKHNYDFIPGKDPNTFQPFPKARVLDLGTNLGIVAGFWSMNGVNVTSYEADPETYKIATDLFTRLDLQVEAINTAIWSHKGKIRFKSLSHMDGDRFCRNGQVDSSPDAVLVPCITLTEVLGDKIWDCVKIDIEGSEFEVLMSVDLEALKNVKYIHLELHEEKYQLGWMTPDQVEQLRGKLEQMFEIRPSVYSTGFWHLFNKEKH
jgi:FkbM family methyltransferase